jgi:hypothetical protein
MRMQEARSWKSGVRNRIQNVLFAVITTAERSPEIPNKEDTISAHLLPVFPKSNIHRELLPTAVHPAGGGPAEVCVRIK